VSIGKTEQDVIVVRGPSTEVDRVVPQILQIVEDAKNDDIINGFVSPCASRRLVGYYRN
jgi:hypothetical protein